MRNKKNRGVIIIQYIRYGLTAFLISLTSSAYSKETIELSDVGWASFFGLLCVGVYYLTQNPFRKDDDEEKDNDN